MTRNEQPGFDPALSDADWRRHATRRALDRRFPRGYEAEYPIF